MIRSMTGFGSAGLTNDLGEFSVEVKSLNNRFLDLSVKLPKELNFLEPELRELVKRHANRGKIELLLRWVPAPGAPPLYEINTALLKHYADRVNEALAENLSNGKASLDMCALLSLPGVVTPARIASDDGKLGQTALESARRALDAFDRSRANEGQAMVAAIQTHVSSLERYREEILLVKDELLEEYRTRLKDRIEVLGKTLGAMIDPARIEAELMLFVDKSDITEELVRLEIHLTAFKKQCQPETGGPVGKAMDFLAQELLREVNTVGNKARGLPIATRIVKMKSEIEKIREQVQNLE